MTPLQRAVLAALAPGDPEAVAWCEDYVARSLNDNLFDAAANGELRLIAAALPAAAVALDIGAHRGAWATRALAANPGLRLHCCEPASANFAALRQAVPNPPAQCHRLAFGARAGVQDLLLVANDLGHSLLDRTAGNTAGDLAVVGREPVPVTTVTAFCAEHGIAELDFLKVDCEGAELDVIEGAQAMIDAAAIGVVQVEYGSTWIAARRLLGDLFAAFHGRRYRVGKLMPDRVVFAARYSAEFETFRYSNWVAARDDWAERLG